MDKAKCTMCVIFSNLVYNFHYSGWTGFEKQHWKLLFTSWESFLSICLCLSWNDHSLGQDLPHLLHLNLLISQFHHSILFSNIFPLPHSKTDLCFSNLHNIIVLPKSSYQLFIIFFCFSNIYLTTAGGTFWNMILNHWFD